MKRKDALWVMQMCRDRDARSEAEREAFDTAIEALKSESIFSADKPRGEWVETAQDYYEMVNKKGGGVKENTEYFIDDIACPNCLAKFSNIDNETERFNFCPNCGVDMRATGGGNKAVSTK